MKRITQRIAALFLTLAVAFSASATPALAMQSTTVRYSSEYSLKSRANLAKSRSVTRNTYRVTYNHGTGVLRFKANERGWKWYSFTVSHITSAYAGKRSQYRNIGMVFLDAKGNVVSRRKKFFQAKDKQSATYKFKLKKSERAVLVFEGDKNYAGNYVKTYATVKCQYLKGYGN